MAKRTLHQFKVESVVLEGTNLIEASAGTGKTYSIAILVLRMLLEKEIQLKEILMVTFTNAAVAELEGLRRLRFSTLVRRRSGSSSMMGGCSSTTATSSRGSSMSTRCCSSTR